MAKGPKRGSDLPPFTLRYLVTSVVSLLHLPLFEETEGWKRASRAPTTKLLEEFQRSNRFILLWPYTSRTLKLRPTASTLRDAFRGFHPALLDPWLTGHVGKVARGDSDRIPLLEADFNFASALMRKHTTLLLRRPSAVRSIMTERIWHQTGGPQRRLLANK
jgi:hypothetical protein